MATITSLLTAEEYFRLPDMGRPSELVRGKIIMMNMPGARHGFICSRICRLLGNFVEQHGLGYVLSNDSGVVTERGPDSVRGADVSFYSFARLPKGQLPRGYPTVSPELVFEVLSPSDRRKDILTKVAEYLNAGVEVVCVVDSGRSIVTTYYPDRPEETIGSDNVLRIPEVLPGFEANVSELFQ